jgi:hypothetical protein
MARQLSERLLAVREIQQDLGLGVPHQVEAVQDASGICVPPNMALLYVRGLQGLLLSALHLSERTQAGGLGVRCT